MNRFDITQRWLYSEKWLLIIVNSWYITNNHRSRMDINEIMWGQQLPRPGKSHPWKWWWLGFPTANARSIQKTRTNTWRTGRICIAYRTMHERHFQAIPALLSKMRIALCIACVAGLSEDVCPNAMDWILNDFDLPAVETLIWKSNKCEDWIVIVAWP